MSLYSDLVEVLTPYANKIKGLVTDVGNLSDLDTEDKSNLVSAINEAAQSGGTEIVIDDTLTQSGQAADAKAAGEAISQLSADLQDKTEDINKDITQIKHSIEKKLSGGNSISYDGDDAIFGVVLNGPATGLYDGVAKIDGVNIAVTSLNGTTENMNLFMISSINKADGATNFISDSLPVLNSTRIERVFGRTNNNKIELCLLKTRCEYSVSAVNAWLQAHPIYVWFETPNYDNATEFYYYASIEKTSVTTVGTLQALPPINDGDTLNLLTGEYSINGDSGSVSVSKRINNIEQEVTITSTGNLTLLVYDKLSNKVSIDGKNEITPFNTTFFDGLNYFKPNTAKVLTGVFVASTGSISVTTNDVFCLVLPVEPDTDYWFFAPEKNRNYIVENDSDNFEIGETYTLLLGTTTSAPVTFRTGHTANYIFIYLYNGVYDYESNKSGIVLNKNKYYGDTALPFIPYKHLPDDLDSPLSNANILIFGDSITSTCAITINENNETTEYTWKNPSNSYVDSQGNTVRYSMWAKILKDSEPCGEIRNYAYSGASYKTAVRESGNERQNLHYQIDVALNDLTNPNNVFDIDAFIPDIVIFALGTNDGTPNDTFESAMNKTVLKSDGYSIDVSATLAALDETKFCESVRKAYIRIKQAFPMAQIFCVLPLQYARNETNFGTLRQYLSDMAKRYGCIIIDGTAESGITREFNNHNSLGVYLKDGLHPNEKGQNLMARMIISSLKSHYLPFKNGFN